MLLWIAIGCAGCSTAAAAATLCTDVLRRSARLLLLPSGFPPWSDRVPAFAWWGDPAAVRVVPQLRHRADAEMCWWFLKSSEQYRVRGKLTVVGNGEDEEEDAALLAVRKQQWGNLRDAAREQFYWTQPGVPLSEEGGAAERAGAGGQGGGCEETAGIPAGGRGQDGKVLPPPPTFLLLLLWPTCIDYLRLTDNCRMVFEQDSGGATWKGKEVSP